jgi:WD40 repeat protein/serine/threonine protein kinase
MSDRPRPADAAGDSVFAQQVDEICDRFEAAWKEAPATGTPPQIEDYLGAASSPESAALLRELILLDVYYRRRCGEQPRAEAYRASFPALDPAWLDREVRALADAEQTTQEGRQVASPADGATVPLERIGDFRILREIGRGGMGVVYEAEQEALGRCVALKILPPHALRNADMVRRFEREARSAARLHHTNIVPVFGAGCHEGMHYFVMQFIQGQGLDAVLTELNRAPASPAVVLPGSSGAASLLESGRTYWQSVARIGIQVAEALEYAHGQGILHRDIKPSNLLQDLHGTVWVTDFGLAKAASEGGDLTHTGDLVGTLRYMAPERFEGRVDARSDLYSLGLTLYEFLALQPAFRATDRNQLIRQVMREEPTPPRRLNTAIPRDLETIVLKAMARDPAHRYQTAAELAIDLQRFVEDRPIRARRVGQVEQFWRWCRRNPVVASLGAAAASLLVAVAVSATVVAVQSYRLARQEERLKSEAENRADVEAKAKEELETNLYFHRITLAHRELSADNLGGALKLLDACPPELRAWEWDYLMRRCRVEPVALHDTTEVYSIAFRPDGEQLASAGRDGKVKVWDVRTRKVIHELSGHQPSYAFSVAFGPPDGRYLASAGADRKVRLWDLTTEREVFCGDGQPGEQVGVAYSVAYSPDGRHLVYGSEGKSAVVWDVADAREVFRLGEHTRAATSVAYSPAGGLLASGDWAGLLRIWDAKTGEILHNLPRAHDHRISALAFRSDGRWLATASFDRSLKVWDVTTGELVRPWRGHSGVIVGLAFSPDGRRLASLGGEDRTVKLWDPWTGREILDLREDTLMCHSVVFSPDGRRLASASSDGTIRIWDATPVTGDKKRESLTRQHDDDVLSVAFSPDGGSFASSGYDGTVRLWDARTGASRYKLPQPGKVLRVAFSPGDGRYLAAAMLMPDRTVVVKVFDAATGEERFPIGEQSWTFPMTFDPEGRYLLNEGPDHSVRVWDLRTRQETGVLGRHREYIFCLTFSPDGRRLASASMDGTVKVWPWDPARLRHEQEPELTLHVRVTTGYSNRVAFHTDSQHLATGGPEHTVQIWDVTQAGQKPQMLRGHTGDVLAVAYSRDGRWFASAGQDTTIRLWDAKSGELRHTLRGHTGWVSSLAFSPDSQRLVSGSMDWTVKVWDLPPREGR